MAVSYLHIIREHPIFLSRYENLFDRKTQEHREERWFKKSARLINALVKCIHKDDCLRDTNPVDVLFISHLINRDQLRDAEDFYFYDLPQHLEKQGISAKVVLINQTKNLSIRAARSLKRGGVPTVVLGFHDGFTSAIRDLLRLKSASAWLKTRAKRETCNLQRQVLLAAADDCVSARSLMNLGIAAQVTSIAASNKPKMTVMTFEGHAWERLVCHLVRQQNSKIQCIAYQHSSLFRLQHAVRHKIGGGWDPDRIMTSGAAARDLLASESQLRGIPVQILGSRRGNGVGFPHLRGRETRRDTIASLGCLVIPEGTKDECRILFEFSLTCAQLFPDMKFIWRLHPILSGKNFLENELFARNLPTNIQISQVSLEDDIHSCDLVIYRGSTAVVKAASAGLLPIYVRRDNELSIDPIYTLGEKRLVVTSPYDLVSVINSEHLAELKCSRAKDLGLKALLESFYAPLQPSVLISCFQEGCGAAGHRGS